MNNLGIFLVLYGTLIITFVLFFAGVIYQRLNKHKLGMFLMTASFCVYVLGMFLFLGLIPDSGVFK